MSEIVLLLDCGHTRIATAKTGTQSAVCPYHRQVREIIGQGKGWGYRCNQCRSNGSFGDAHNACLARAYRHQREKPGHTTRILFGDKVIVVLAAYDLQLELPFDVPPF